MARRPIKTKDWERFLEAHKCKFKREKASHAHYQCPGCFRPVTHRPKDKEVPAMHLQTNLRTMGLNLDYLYEWLENN